MMNYFSKREEMKQKAVKHNEDMVKLYSQFINNSIDGSIIYDKNSVFCKHEVINTDIYNAVDTCYNVEGIQSPSITVLNFASYLNPGGKFMEGSSAQEESICHATTLYPVLKSQQSYYDWNEKHKNRGLYDDRAIWSPNILFIGSKNPDRFINVITCAAPNNSVALRYHNFTAEENERAVVDRMYFILDIFCQHPTDVLMLGAWGCGVFKQNPVSIAIKFKTIFRYCPAKKVIYPIPDMETCSVFKSIIG